MASEGVVHAAEILDIEHSNGAARSELIGVLSQPPKPLTEQLAFGEPREYLKIGQQTDAPVLL